LRTILIISLLGVFFFSVPEPMFAQRASREVRKVEKKREKEKKADRRNFEKEREKQLQEHIRLQTPEVQERMKQNKRESRRWGRHKKEPFYLRWLRKK
jgi:hypothetical protein